MTIIKKIGLLVALSGLLSTACPAQSLKPESPAPVQSGVNKGTTDNFVGAHYWYFIAEPGDCKVHVLFKPMGLFGNAQRTPLTVTLTDAGHTWKTDKVLWASDKPAEVTIPGHIKKDPTKVIIILAPPSGGLTRMGGDYELEVTGAVKFGQMASGDPIVRTYKQMGGYTKDLGATKFLANGTVVTAAGETGKWALFDAGSHTYTIDIDGQERKSLQYVPGRGLVDGDLIIFQELR